MWRNEIGVAKYKSKTGDIYHVPYGIPGPGGSDLLGYTMYTITAADVGKSLPIFTGAECKWKGKKARDNQQKFIDHILSVGGYGGTVRSDEDYLKLIGAA